MDDHVLLERARRAAEWGRFRAAARALGAVVPLGGVAALAGASPGTCLAGSWLLAVVAVGLRWWHRDGWTGTSLGLRVGLAPYAVGVVATCLGTEGSTGLAWACAVACGALLAAAASSATRPATARAAGVGVVVAGLTGLLGCAALLSGT